MKHVKRNIYDINSYFALTHNAQFDRLLVCALSGINQDARGGSRLCKVRKDTGDFQNPGRMVDREEEYQKVSKYTISKKKVSNSRSEYRQTCFPQTQGELDGWLWLIVKSVGFVQ